MTIIAEFRDLRIHEVYNGYQIEHIPSGESRGIGDGVDMYSAILGTSSWAGEAADDLESNYDIWLEVYFPEQR